MEQKRRVPGKDLGIGVVACIACILLLPAACMQRPHGGAASAPEESTMSTNESPAPPVESTAAPIELPGGIVVDRTTSEVVVPAVVSIDVGWLEQMVCSRHSRDHEALLVIDVAPSQVHAGLMLLGLEPGSPGRWVFETIEGSDRVVVRRIAPTGDRVSVLVRRVDVDGTELEHPIADWVMGEGGERAFPEVPWVFGGSLFLAEGPDPEGPSFYAADRSGSLVGLVTFGDEVLGLESILSDQISVDAAEWEARTDVMPAPGTKVELVLRPFEAP